MRRKYLAGDFLGAVQLARGAAEIVGRDPDALATYACALIRLGVSDEAIRVLNGVLQMRPDMVSARVELASAHMLRGDLASAHAAVDEAMRLRPGDLAAISVKSDIHRMGGEFDRAYETAAAPARAGYWPAVMAMARASLLVGRAPEGIESLQRGLRSPGLPAVARVQGLFLLGRLLDHVGEYERAFGAFEEANRAKGSRFDGGEHERSIDALIEAWDAGRFRSLPRAADRSDDLVFIIGMPRSGTSLTEQILSCHPSVRSCGEQNRIVQLVVGVEKRAVERPLLTHVDKITADILDRFAAWYRRSVGRGERVTDKYMFNYLHLGAIALAFPGAKVVHCVRDALDTCVSCFANNFAGVDADFKPDLRSLGTYYRCYRRLMEHWEGVVDIPIHRVAYEDLARQPEGTIRSLLGFLVLGWDEGCLRFHESERVTTTQSNEQVRQPMYTTSIGRYRHYEAFLGPLREAIGEWVSR